jgi:hypothetical protein
VEFCIQAKILKEALGYATCTTAFGARILLSASSHRPVFRSSENYSLEKQATVAGKEGVLLLAYELSEE